MSQIAKAFELAKMKAEENGMNTMTMEEVDKVCPGGSLLWRNVCLPISIGF